MTPCLFCRIVSGASPASVVYQDQEILAFHDVHPKAPLHVLVIPRRHISTLNDVSDADDRLVGALVRRAAAIARDHGYEESGYRTVFNCNRQAGQSVFHIHLHLLAGRWLGWPPG